jgi:hypothetical protein
MMFGAAKKTKTKTKTDQQKFNNEQRTTAKRSDYFL